VNRRVARGRRFRPIAGLLLGASSIAFAVVVDPIEPPTQYEFLLELPPANAPVPAVQGADDPIGVSPEERRQFARYLSKSPLARKRVANPDGSVDFFLRNRLHAPVTVEFEDPAPTGASVKMLTPAHVTIAPMAVLEVAEVRADVPLQPGEVDFRYSAVIGDPSAKHDDRVVYGWPFPAGTHAELTQGPGGPTHHDSYSRYAIDLAVPEGTPVLAARAGTVVFLENRFFESGMDRLKYLSRANQVRILHDDGSMASYAHLLPASIDLEPGQHVEQGQQIGLSGNTGYSSGPHLHFSVQVHRDMEMVSIPFTMRGVGKLSRAP
jgi:murein DD-endopeptidase MepM/ murein hydrolase activator NlpD